MAKRRKSKARAHTKVVKGRRVPVQGYKFVKGGGGRVVKVRKRR